MNTASFWIVGAPAWYLVGFLSLCISNAFEGPPNNYAEWLELRRICYILAALGPIITVIIILIWTHFGLRDSFKYIMNIALPKATRDRICAKLMKPTDWMIVGFRKPPTPPTTKGSINPSGFPTVSP